jgi:hypothetical protein
MKYAHFVSGVEAVLIMSFFSVHVSYINSIGNRFLNALKVSDIYESTDQ